MAFSNYWGCRDVMLSKRSGLCLQGSDMGVPLFLAGMDGQPQKQTGTWNAPALQVHSVWSKQVCVLEAIAQCWDLNRGRCGASGAGPVVEPVSGEGSLLEGGVAAESWLPLQHQPGYAAHWVPPTSGSPSEVFCQEILFWLQEVFPSCQSLSNLIFVKVHSVQSPFWTQTSSCVVYDFPITIPCPGLLRHGLAN